jgi:hypothetical protein
MPAFDTQTTAHSPALGNAWTLFLANALAAVGRLMALEFVPVVQAWN